MKKAVLWALVCLVLAFGLFSCGSSSSNQSGASSSSKAITAYSFSNPPAIGTINETDKTIAITVPHGTDVAALVATFTTTGASVKVGGTVQVGGSTPNNFTNSVVYTVTAADGSTADYTVTVTVALNSSKAITSFSIFDIPCSINESSKTISLSVPYGTDVSSLAATFTTTGASVMVGGTVQVSGTTTNNFRNPVVYTVTATDGSTAQYIITVIVASTIVHGDIDLNFGENGKVLTAIGNGSDGSSANSLAIQADGKIVVAGATRNGSYNEVAVVRYNADGSKDLSFGSGGVVTTAVNNASIEGMAVKVQTDGKIIVAGNADGKFALIRYLTDGAADSTFGVNGLIITDVNPYPARVYALTLQDDDKYVVAGSAGAGSAVFALARYDLNGNIDSNFGSSGIVVTQINEYSYDSISAIATQTDGKIIVAGYTQKQGSHDGIALARYDNNGNLDVSFGVNGVVVVDDYASWSKHANALVIQTDGKIIIAVSAFNKITGSSSQIQLMRFDMSGSLDASFGSNGISSISVQTWNWASALLIQDDGRLLVAGSSSNSNQADSDSNFALARFDGNGLLDTSFGNGGALMTDIKSNSSDFLAAIALQNDDKIVATGATLYQGASTSGTGNNAVFTVVRYWL